MSRSPNTRNRTRGRGSEPPTRDSKLFGMKLVELRNLCGWGVQGEFAKAAGIPYTEVSKIENGHVKLKRDTHYYKAVGAMAAVFDVDEYDLLRYLKGEITRDELSPMHRDGSRVVGPWVKEISNQRVTDSVVPSISDEPLVEIALAALEMMGESPVVLDAARLVITKNPSRYDSSVKIKQLVETVRREMGALSATGSGNHLAVYDESVIRTGPPSIPPKKPNGVYRSIRVRSLKK